MFKFFKNRDKEIFETIRSIIINVQYEYASSRQKFNMDNIRYDSNVQDFGMDSLDVVELIMALEKHYDIRIDDSEFDNFPTIQDLINVVKKHLK